MASPTGLPVDPNPKKGRTFWEWYARGAAIAGAGAVGLLVWKISQGTDETWWRSPSSIALITALVGAIAPVTAFVLSWAKLQLEALKQHHEIATAQTQQRHQITTDYLTRALNPEVPIVFRNQLLRFLSTDADDGHQMQRWAGAELVRLAPATLHLTRDVEAAQKQIEAAKDQPALIAAEQRLIEAELRRATAAEAPRAPPLTVEALRAGAFQNKDVGALELPEADLHSAELAAIKMCNSNLRGADLTGAFLQMCDARGSNFDRVNFKNALLAQSDFRGASFRGAKFAGARAAQARFEGCDLSGAQGLAKDNLGVYYDASTKWPDGFDPKAAGCILVPRDEPSGA